LAEGEIGLKILHAETGNIGNNDVMLALRQKRLSSALTSRQMWTPAAWLKKKA
jgi:hypothetical protein